MHGEFISEIFYQAWISIIKLESLNEENKTMAKRVTRLYIKHSWYFKLLSDI